MKKVLILGINSFSGATYAKYIQHKKYDLFGVYHKKKDNIYTLYNEKKFKLKKISNLKAVKLSNYISQINPDIIIDFASICMVNESWKYQKYYNKVNVLSKKILIDALEKKKFSGKYIYISTPEIFGSCELIKENSKKFKPSTPYALSKLKAEKLFLNSFKKKKFPIIICRFSNFYGPGQPIFRLIPKLCVTLDLNKKFSIHGDGSSVRNFIFSSDFCKGIDLAISKGQIGNCYHFSGKEKISIRDIIKKICKLKKKNYNKSIKYSPDRKTVDQVYFLSTSKTEKLLDWKPKINLEKGLKQTINFYKKKLFLLKKMKFEYKFSI